MEKIKTILLVMAMRDEARSIIRDLGLTLLKKHSTKLSIETYGGKYGDKQIWLQLNGRCPSFGVDNIGTDPSVLNTYTGIVNYKPDLILNAGTAGGFARANAKVGDTYLSHPYVYHHDRRINIPGFNEYGIGKYSCYPCEDIAKRLGLKTGIISTGNSLDHTPLDLEIIETHNGEVKEMEAAAIAWLANTYGIPFLAIKTITDIVDGPESTEDEFLKNLNYASKILGEKTIELIEVL